uniref:Ataxin-10 domain-containing protein n=1 Tax=Timspurckia oligopyrenoides TaxID=708627 RepID=A0A7S0ZBJ4_9RHOD|mmetsp:Transcript_1144/g.2136  ORF Transcript_1144/g.2136 Transcript_1144/m.2136 type:complete len:579 (+) Transcript_1144:24-1760(+)
MHEEIDMSSTGDLSYDLNWDLNSWFDWTPTLRKLLQELNSFDEKDQIILNLCSNSFAVFVSRCYENLSQSLQNKNHLRVSLGSGPILYSTELYVSLISRILRALVAQDLQSIRNWITLNAIHKYALNALQSSVQLNYPDALSHERWHLYTFQFLHNCTIQNESVSKDIIEMMSVKLMNKNASGTKDEIFDLLESGMRSECGRIRCACLSVVVNACINLKSSSEFELVSRVNECGGTIQQIFTLHHEINMRLNGNFNENKGENEDSEEEWNIWIDCLLKNLLERDLFCVLFKQCCESINVGVDSIGLVDVIFTSSILQALESALDAEFHRDPSENQGLSSSKVLNNSSALYLFCVSSKSIQCITTLFHGMIFNAALKPRNNHNNCENCLTSVERCEIIHCCCGILSTVALCFTEFQFVASPTTRSSESLKQISKMHRNQLVIAAECCLNVLRILEDQSLSVSHALDSVSDGIRVDVIRLLALCSAIIPDEIHDQGGIELILCQTQLFDGNNMYTREWSIVAVRELCTRSESCRKRIAQLQLHEIRNNQRLTEAGFEAFLDPNTNQPRLRSVVPTVRHPN